MQLAGISATSTHSLTEPNSIESVAAVWGWASLSFPLLIVDAKDRL